jgi:hypothetical protein
VYPSSSRGRDFRRRVAAADRLTHSALAAGCPRHDVASMPTIDPTPGEGTDAPLLEAEAAKRRWLASEATMIAEARASGASCRVVSSKAVDAWIDSLDTGHEPPPPRSGR